MGSVKFGASVIIALLICSCVYNQHKEKEKKIAAFAESRTQISTEDTISTEDIIQAEDTISTEDNKKIDIYNLVNCSDMKIDTLAVHMSVNENGDRETEEGWTFHIFEELFNHIYYRELLKTQYFSFINF